jgi:hypothetical protein
MTGKLSPRTGSHSETLGHQACGAVGPGHGIAREDRLGTTNAINGGGVKLYHGSNVAVAHPRIQVPRRALDFGPGFYVTSSLDQAWAWARVKHRRLTRGEPTVTSYDFGTDQIAGLSSHVFDEPSGKWLDFVVANRRTKAISRAYDLVIGPVANDNTLPVIDDYMRGTLTKDEAVRRLLPQKLVDQYAFLTARALTYLGHAKVVVS